MCHCFNDFSDSFLSLEASFAFNLFSILGGLLGFSSSCLSFFFPPVFSPFPPITMKGNTNQSQLCTSSNSALSFRPEITSFTAWTPSLLTHTHTHIHSSSSATLTSPIHTQKSTNKVTHQFFLQSHQGIGPHSTDFCPCCRQSKYSVCDGNISWIKVTEACWKLGRSAFQRPFYVWRPQYLAFLHTLLEVYSHLLDSPLTCSFRNGSLYPIIPLLCLSVVLFVFKAPFRLHLLLPGELWLRRVKTCLWPCLL